MPIYDFVKPEDIQRHYKTLDSLLLKKETVELQLRALKRLREDLWFSMLGDSTFKPGSNEEIRSYQIYCQDPDLIQQQRDQQDELENIEANITRIKAEIEKTRMLISYYGANHNA